MTLSNSVFDPGIFVRLLLSCMMISWKDYDLDKPSLDFIYRQISDIRRILGNKIIDHSDVVGAACRRCSNYIFIMDLIPGFNGLGKGICKTRREAFQFWYLVRLILEIWRYCSLVFMETMIAHVSCGRWWVQYEHCHSWQMIVEQKARDGWKLSYPSTGTIVRWLLEGTILLTLISCNLSMGQ